MPGSMWRIDLPHTDAPLTPNRRRGWRAYSGPIKAIRESSAWAIKAARVPSLPFAHLYVHVEVPDWRRRDSDNWVPYLVKPIKDAVVDAGVLVDDDTTHCTWQVVDHPPTEARAWRYWLVIEAGELREGAA